MAPLFRYLCTLLSRVVSSNVMLEGSIERGRTMMWDSAEGMGWWMLMGSVWFIVFWGIVIWPVARVTSREAKNASPGAIDIARQRYASGEITKEQFDDIHRNLAA